MKKLGALLTCMLLLICAGAQADAATLAPDGGALIALDDYPIVDGSTATLPLSYALMQAFTGCTAEQAEQTIRHTKTTNSFYQLADGMCDILLVYEPNQDALDYMKTAKVKYSMKPIGRDALVFLVNAKNPISELTSSDVKGIYTGKITDWSKIPGGADLPILAYQRPDDSGSQVMMLKLAMRDAQIMAAPTDKVIDEMGGLVDQIADYDNAPGAIGYSVWYYAANMYANANVKMLSIDDAAPSAENIESGAYPYVQPFYVVLRKDAPKSSAQRRIYNFLLTDKGQDFVRGCGYAGAGNDAQKSK